MPKLESEIDTKHFSGEFTKSSINSHEESPKLNEGMILEEKFKDFSVWFCLLGIPF